MNKKEKRQLKKQIISFLATKPQGKFKSKEIARILKINSANYVNFSGFTVKNGSSAGGIGIEINSKYNNITYNIIWKSYWGIALKASYNTLTGNIIRNNNNKGIDIRSYSKYNTIASNNIISNGNGVYLYTSRYNTIRDNNISNNYIGINVREYSKNIKIFNNFISNNNDMGIHLDRSNVLVKDNSC